MAGRKRRHQLVLSVLLLPVGGGEDDIDIGAGVLGLGGGGVPGPGHGGGVVSVDGPLVISGFVPTCHQQVLHIMCNVTIQDVVSK